MEQLASLFKALADPNRLRLVNILSQCSICVSDLQTVLGLSQPFISRHLACLRKVKLVRTRREGPRVCYSLARASLFSYPLQSFLREVLPYSPGLQADLERLAECGNSGRLKSVAFRQHPVTSEGGQNAQEGTSPAPGPIASTRTERPHGGNP